jgi:hypothetical protein
MMVGSLNSDTILISKTRVPSRYKKVGSHICLGMGIGTDTDTDTDTAVDLPTVIEETTEFNKHRNLEL